MKSVMKKSLMSLALTLILLSASQAEAASVKTRLMIPNVAGSVMVNNGAQQAVSGPNASGQVQQVLNLNRGHYAAPGELGTGENRVVFMTDYGQHTLYLQISGQLNPREDLSLDLYRNHYVLSDSSGSAVAIGNVD